MKTNSVLLGLVFAAAFVFFVNSTASAQYIRGGAIAVDLGRTHIVVGSSGHYGPYGARYGVPPYGPPPYYGGGYYPAPYPRPLPPPPPHVGPYGPPRGPYGPGYGPGPGRPYHGPYYR